jgi:hypothetical protein
MPLYRWWWKKETNFVGAATAITSNTIGRITVGTAGSTTAAWAGMLLFGPCGGVVGTLLGSYYGARAGRHLATIARRLLTASEQAAVTDCAVRLAGQALDSTPTKQRAWQEKHDTLEECLSARTPAKEAIRAYVLQRERDDRAYLEHRARDLEEFRSSAKDLDAREAWSRVLLLVKQAGIHASAYQASLEELRRLIDALEKAEKQWLLT